MVWDQAFEDSVLSDVNSYVGQRCPQIDFDLVVKYGYDGTINNTMKSYCNKLSKRMLGYNTVNGVDLASHGYKLKSITVRPDGRIKEYISFPAFNGNSLMVQGWEDSDLYKELTKRSLIMVFQYISRPVAYNQDNIVFGGGFFWNMDDSDMELVHEVWEDTKHKIIDRRMDEFIRAKDGRLAFVKPHGANGNDVYKCNDVVVKKESFWIQSDYMGRVVHANLDLQKYSSGTKDGSPSETA